MLRPTRLDKSNHEKYSFKSVDAAKKNPTDVLLNQLYSIPYIFRRFEDIKTSGFFFIFYELES